MSMNYEKLSNKDLELVARTIRLLAVDGVEKANSGHPGMPMGMAELAAVLWLKHLHFNPKDPKWLARDRFVVSNGHGSMLLYSMLHLAGYAVSLDDLKAFRQWDSITPGHPESGMTPGVECTTGPLGQGISNAVGMAIGQKVFSTRYNTAQNRIVDHNVFVFAGDGCLMEGISSEASSVAGHLRLGNLKVIYDDNHISIAGRTDLAFSEDVLKRYEAYGWFVQRIDGHDFRQIDEALSRAVAETARPSIIAARTTIGLGSPNKADTSEVHGSPLGAEEVKLTKEGLGWPTDQTFYVPDLVREIFAARVEELSGFYAKWQEGFAAWSRSNPEKAAQLAAQRELRVPDDLEEKLVASLGKSASSPAATRKLSSIVLQAVAREIPSVIGGSADLEPSTLTVIKDSSSISADSFAGVNIHFGVREHGMGAIMNGLAYYGGFVPFGSTFLVFADYMRPAIRLAALSHLPSLFVFTHDSVFLGEDGPTHQPIEHLNSLRAMPNLCVFRPADAVETAVCYALALRRQNGPSVLALTRQNVTPLERPAGFELSDIGRGAYAVAESMTGKPELVFVATGSEVELALAAVKQLGLDGKARVVSMPCWELFASQPKEYRQNLIPPSAKKVVVEAGSTFGWLGMIDGSPDNTLLIGIDRFGASAPAKVLAEKFGLTPQALAAKVKDRFAL